jgi:hypothetical protein
VKSVEEFVLGKSRKGSASLEGRVKHKTYFELHDRNEEHCERAKALLPRVQHELTRLQDLIAPHRL